MYHNPLSFVIVSGSGAVENALDGISPLEDCSYSFSTVKSIDEALPFCGNVDTAFILDLTENTFSRTDTEKLCAAECAAIFSSGSEALSDAETVSAFGSIWVLPEGKPDEKLISAYFSKLAEKMKFMADSRKQGICFYTMINSVPDIAWYKDTAGSHLIVNDSFCALVGKTKEQIYKKGHCYIWDATPEDEEVCLSSDRLIMDSRKTNTFEEEVVTENETLLLKSFKSPLIDVNGEIFGTCGTARDVTEFKNATTEIQILLDSFPYVVLLENEEKKVVSKNMLFDQYFPAFSDITGHSSAKWKNSLNIRTINGTKQKAVIIGHGEKERTLLLEEEPLLDIFYHDKGKIITLADITDERNINKELQESKLKAQEANRAKSAFIANMSHEIRTPINSIIGMNEMILRESSDQEIRNYALGARRSANILLGLVNDILDFSKIESGKMEINCTEYETAELFSDAVKLVMPRAVAKSLVILTDIDPTIPSRLYGDDVKLRQIIVNLLTNAVKYTKVGTVTVSAKGEVSGDELSMSISVTDTGIGVKPEDMDNIFAAFKRLDDSETRIIEGTGLGLNITNKLLTLMDSKLDVESVYGKGSTFYFTVKQKIVDSAPVGELHISYENEDDDFSYTVSFAAPDAKILVVDDNEMNRVVFRSLLKQTKVQITEAESGQECLALVEKEHFDIIFLDHMMPVMDGIETFRRIKSGDNLCKDVPVIALTANAVTGARETYIGEGFTNFLSKPISSVLLEKMITDYLPAELVQEFTAETAEPQASLPEIEGFNFDIARLYANSDDVIKASLDLFGDNLVKSAALLEYYLPTVENGPEELELYRIQAHSLKGTAAIVGAMQLSELAKTAEYAAKASDTGRIKALTPILIDETKACLSRVKAAGIYKSKPENPELSALTEKVRKILSLSEEFMLDEADEIMDELYSYSYPDEIQVQIELLKIAEINTDTESMEKIIGKLESMNL